MSGDHNQYQKDQFPDTTKMIGREGVGLTDAEIEGMFMANSCCDDSVVYEYVARAIEAKLKEKNAYGWQSVANPTEYLDDLRGGKDT
jgi:hypothetical protein